MSIQKRLEALAYAKTKPFCYSCYKTAPSGRCKHCGSDDLMRELDGVGVEYGVDWVIEHLISEGELTPIDWDEHMEQMIDDCYGATVKIGWMEYDTSRAIRELDPISWRCAISDEISNLLADDQIIEFKGEYYYVHDVESWLDDQELEVAV